MSLKRAIELADAGNWEAAHEIVANDNTAEAAWLHANLHREEGDAGNASYWYSRAGKPVSDLPFDKERAQIRAALEL